MIIPNSSHMYIDVPEVYYSNADTAPGLSGAAAGLGVRGVMPRRYLAKKEQGRWILASFPGSLHETKTNCYSSSLSLVDTQLLYIVICFLCH